jgi:3-methyladenine DNA glycosylase AlkC
MAIKAEPTFSLKDQLFNKTKVSKIADEIVEVYPEFQTKQFVAKVTKKFPELELLQRLYWIRDCLCEFLPDDYRAAVKVLLKSLPVQCDPTLSDNDFGDFIYGPYGAFIAEYGCTKNDLQFSLNALREMTKRFSVEFPIRTFINTFPDETVVFLQRCAINKHYHVRRLSSEGTRPTLPWAKNICIDYKTPLSILDILHTDPTRFVTRSVANHMNDISKVDPILVMKTLKRWQKEGIQDSKEIDFITRHSLRTLEKQGNAAALDLLGYTAAEIEVTDLKVATPQVKIGDVLAFSFSITSVSTKEQELLIDYNLFFQKASGILAPKTFKIAKVSIQPGETLLFSKQQPMRPMTTRVLHSGRHEVELQINGCTFSRVPFVLHV